MSHERQGILFMWIDCTDLGKLAGCEAVGGIHESRWADRTDDLNLAVCLSPDIGCQENVRHRMDLCRAADPGDAVHADLRAR